MDITHLKEGDAILLRQQGFKLPEPAIFLRYYPRGKTDIIEIAIFVRTGAVCPLNQWKSFAIIRDTDLATYAKDVHKWHKRKPIRVREEFLDYFKDLKDYDLWRKDWIQSGRLYRDYEHRFIFDEDDSRNLQVTWTLDADIFLKSQEIIIGEMKPIADVKIKSACLNLRPFLLKHQWPW